MRHFRVLLYPQEPELAPPGPLDSLGIEEMRETAPIEAVGSILAVGEEAKKEILVYLTQLLTNLPGTPIGQLANWLPDQWKLFHAA